MAIAQKKRQTTEELEKELEELMSQEQKADVSTEKEVPEEETPEVKPEEETSEKPKEDNKTSDEESTFKKRYGDLRRHSQAQIKDLKDEIAKLKESVKKDIRPLASDETVQEWKDKYPDIASIVETVADRIAQEKFDAANLDLDEIKQFKKDTTKEQTLSTIRKKHSDFDDIVGSDEFEEWIDEQPEWASDALYSSSYNAKSAIRVLDLYKADMGLVDKVKRKRSEDAARSTKTNSSTPEVRESEPQYEFTESQIESMSMKEYADNEEAIIKAQKAGKIFMDRSGGAR